MTEEAEGQAVSWRIGWLRPALGLVQGVALWLLSEAASHHLWPAATPPLYGALLLALVLAPLVAIGGLGRIRPLTLALWTAAAAAAVGLFAWHDIDAWVWQPYDADQPRLAPAFEVFFFGAVFVFIGHHLVGPADAARRWIAPYPAYFDWAWKDAVQLALSALFVGVFWGALTLGAELFRLIGVEAGRQLISQRWFALPATGAAFGAAVQLTDVRVALIRGVRTVGLVLLSWLLPLMTAIVAAFLVALPLTGLSHLFGSASATAILLLAAAHLIVLASAAYQDGQSPTHLAQRWAARIAGVALVPLVLIAGYALWLRIAQHGLTPARIEAGVCVLVGAGFAAGYALAACRARPWMKPLEATNVVMAVAMLAAILAIFTPLADPARLAVDDQVGRLMAGKIAPPAFDYDFLINRGGRYGFEAAKRLEALKGSPRNLAIAGAAQTADRNTGNPAPPPPWWRQARVYPAGARLPDAFVAQFPDGPPQITIIPLLGETSACFTTSDLPCEAFVLDIDGDGAPEVLLSQGTSDHGADVLQAYKAGADGHWSPLGVLIVPCPDAMAALRAGQVKLTTGSDVEIGLAGHRQRLLAPDDAACPSPAGLAPPRPTAPAAEKPLLALRASRR